MSWFLLAAWCSSYQLPQCCTQPALSRLSLGMPGLSHLPAGQPGRCVLQPAHDSSPPHLSSWQFWAVHVTQHSLHGMLPCCEPTMVQPWDKQTPLHTDSQYWRAVPMTVFALDYCIRYPACSVTEIAAKELQTVSISEYSNSQEMLARFGVADPAQLNPEALKAAAESGQDRF